MSDSDDETLDTPLPLKFHWGNALFLVAVHVLAALGIAYLVFVRFSWATLALAAVMFFLCGMSITGGYHRLFAHVAYRGRWPLRLFYLLFGAASVQNSALMWASDHRRHHRHTDTDRDPYNIKKGFWWAHVGWVLFKEGGHALPPKGVADLERDPLVRFQHRHYPAIAAAVALLLPVSVSMLWGDPVGGLLVAGFLRLALQYHATFAINSVAHTIGRQPFGGAVTARDHALTAFITLGEGYHNFHHRFPSDYRNGHAWRHFDPTKWWIWTMARTGLASDLKRTAPETLVNRAG